MRLISALALLALPAFAQTPTEPTPREVNFEKADVIEGSGVAPDLEPVQARQLERARSLIHIRTDFRPEMLRSVEDI